MNSPAATLSLITPFCLSFFFWIQSDSIYLVFRSVLLSLSGSLPPSLSSSVVQSPLFAPDCESALLWQFCCRAQLTCMCCCIAMSSPIAPHHPDVLRVRAVLPSKRGNAERMLHQCCGQDYLKNLLKLIRRFMISAHSAPHTDRLWIIVLRDLNEAISVWSMSLFSVLTSSFWDDSRPFQCWIITFLMYYHYTGWI